MNASSPKLADLDVHVAALRAALPGWRVKACVFANSYGEAYGDGYGVAIENIADQAAGAAVRRAGKRFSDASHTSPQSLTDGLVAWVGELGLDA
jgi:hypothetical protein